ncbi:hypothetical protein [Kitasatospora mediocidica]|uniref:hypothetical protein n=1 Tax=Kitasatospora mediocidica TaxID=58352 RepID=UPI0005612E70|nr:hypothetical protein [Kitasatospora mediocidica]
MTGFSTLAVRVSTVLAFCLGSAILAAPLALAGPALSDGPAVVTGSTSGGGSSPAGDIIWD